ncbi:hypothetical protein KKP97_01860 [Methanothermococcus sp. SCGC AD-155-C09]|nr:hypothetical protein [Methanothermococcus sp. SCGC AD-155-C09]
MGKSVITFIPCRVENELTLMKVYATRNYLTTRSFVREVLMYCRNKVKFLIDHFMGS